VGHFFRLARKVWRGGQGRSRVFYRPWYKSLTAGSSWPCSTAGGMAQALALAKQRPFDLILSDVRMTGGTGYDVIEVVKADPALRAVPFVFLTATMVDQRDRVRGLALGVARFLVRPTEPRALLAEIQACLREVGKP
jgi:two-component system, cell cycle response regulator